MPGQTLCLRRWPQGHPDRERLAAIHLTLQHVGQQGVSFVPVPWRTRDGTTMVQAAGHLWELTDWMPGQADYQRNPSRPRLEAILRALALFHGAAATARPTEPSEAPAGVRRRQRRTRELVAGRDQQLAAAVQSSPSSPLKSRALSVIELGRQLAPLLLPTIDRAVDIAVPLQPCIRDLWHDHVLLTGDEVTGLIDFGAMDTETVATDIARLLGSLVGDDPQGWQQGLLAYESVRGLSPPERTLVFAIDRANVALSGWQWMEWLFAQGKHFDDEARVVQRLEQIITRMEWLLLQSHNSAAP